jgi:hypothetical protein
MFVWDKEYKAFITTIKYELNKGNNKYRLKVYFDVSTSKTYFSGIYDNVVPRSENK